MPNVLRSHTLRAYILTRFGLVQLLAVEERPDIPPAPGHLATLDDNVRALAEALR